ncbi:MAG: J domain-containing protein [Desulfosarcina sp.]
MTTSPHHHRPPHRSLARFVRQIAACADTPTVIMTVAADAEYVDFCRAIAVPAIPADPLFTDILGTICHAHGINPIHLRERLSPAARALGLQSGYCGNSDFYDILNVDPLATGGQIKEAFRHKALEFHPDTRTDPAGGGQAFIQLNDAYQTLRDPHMRRHYDAVCRYTDRWRESPGQSLAAKRPSRVAWWVVTALLLIFILLILATEIMLKPSDFQPIQANVPVKLKHPVEAKTTN